MFFAFFVFFESWNQKHGQRGQHGQHGQQGHYKQRQFPTRGASETTFVYKDAIQVFFFTVIYVPDLFGIRHLRKKVLDRERVNKKERERG